MFFFSLFLLFFIKFALVCTSDDDDRSFNNSNCSLSFTVATIYQSNKIQTDFPIQLNANYKLTCNLSHLVAYYKITPLSILIFGQYKNPDENLKSMIELNSTTFRFNINQSSTIRLCVLSDDDDDDDDDEHDNDHRICRQIHIGINTLYNFWNFPMKFVYLFALSAIGCYYILFFLWDKWRKSGKKSKSLPRKPPITSSEGVHDTFENEKVHEQETSDEE